MRPVVIAAVSSIAVLATLSYLTYSGYKSKSQEKQATVIIKQNQTEQNNADTAHAVLPTIIDTTVTANKPSVKLEEKPARAIQSHTERNEFVYDPSKSNYINARQGTKLVFPDSAFVDAETGNPITTAALVKVEEYYAMDDIFMNDLHTMSDSGLLETNGMINVRVTANNRPCKLANNKKMDVSFPLVNNKKGMQLFVKDVDDINGVWRSIEYTYSAPIVSTEISDKEKAAGTYAPRLSSDINSLRYYIDNSVRPGYSGWSGTMVVEFMVDETGKTTDIKILKEIHKDATAQIGVALSKLIWRKGFKNFRPARYTATMAFHYNANMGGVTKIEFTKPFEYAPYLPVRTHTESFPTSTLGWINCDRFILFSKRTNLYINDSTNERPDVKIVFNKYKSILSATIRDDKYGFENIPADEPITVVAVRKKADKYLISLVPSNSSAQQIGNFDFKLVSKEELKQIILSLDKISTPNPANTTAMR